MLRPWQEIFLSIPKNEEEVEKEHDHLEEFQIVDPPADSEDQEENHGGDDVAQDVEDAPPREEAAGDGEDNLEDHLYDDPLFPDTPTPSSEKEDEKEEEEEKEEGGEESEGGSSSSEEPADPEEEEGEGAEETDTSGSSEEEPEGDEEPDSSEEEGETEEEEEEGEEAEEGGENSAAAFDIRLEALKERRLQAALATIFEKISEDLSGWPVEGDDEWDVQAIMERRISKRPLSHCRQSRERERVVLILDTSGSCSDYADFFSRVASLAERLGSVEIHEAPNAWIEEPERWEQFRRRTIVFLGDFDGGDCLVHAAKQNKLYWFSTENRYHDMLEHSWNHYSLRAFKGKYFPCQTQDDIVRLARKIR